MRVAVLGGSGSFGQAFVRRILDTDAQRVVVYSRDEVKQAEMERSFRHHPAFSKLRMFIGDVRDLDRMGLALHNIDIVVHAAAMKRIEVCERDPMEAIATNIMGSVNVILACIRSSVTKCVALSTDKSVDPTNLYGATKMAMERLFIAANNIAAGRCAFSAVRYGNVFGSRGSVVPIWRDLISRGEQIQMTDATATRFYMTLDDAVDLVLGTIKTMKGGEINLPVLRAYQLGDLAEAMGATKIKIVGMPRYEKLHEVLGDGQSSDFAPRMTIKDLKAAL